MPRYLFAILLLTAAVSNAELPDYHGPYDTVSTIITVGTFVSGGSQEAILYYPVNY